MGGTFSVSKLYMAVKGNEVQKQLGSWGRIACAGRIESCGGPEASVPDVPQSTSLCSRFLSLAEQGKRFFYCWPFGSCLVMRKVKVHSEISGSFWASPACLLVVKRLPRRAGRKRGLRSHLLFAKLNLLIIQYCKLEVFW